MASDSLDDGFRRRGRYSGRRLIVRLLLLILLGIGGLFLMSISAGPPNHLGARQGKLAPCPDSPNCVSTQAVREEQRMAPIPFPGAADTAVDALKQVIETSYPRARLVAESDRYLHYEFSSLIFRFVDDVEFVIDDEHRLIHFRSASRVGYSDMGVNRNRMENLTAKLEAAGLGTPDDREDDER